MSQKKTPAYYRFLQDMATQKLSYYESDEIEDAAYDLVDEGKLDDAHYLVEHGLKLHPGDENLELIMVWLLMHSQRVNEAEALFEKYKNEDSDMVLRLKFEFDVFNGHPHQALSQFLPLLHSGKIHPADWMQTINEVFDELTPEVLVPYLIMSMDMLPENAEAWGQLGGLLMDMRSFQQATIALEHSIDIDAYNIYSWQDLSRCYLTMGEDEKCADACDYGLAIDPQNPVLNFTRGMIHYNKEQYKEAIPMLEVARQFAEGKLKTEAYVGNEMERREQTYGTYRMLGHCYQQTEQSEKAIECFEILAERNPKDVEAIVNLSTLYLEKGDTPKALDVTIKALELHPKDAPLMALKVTLLTSMHRFDESLEALDKLIALKPRTYSYRLAKAHLCISLGRDEEGDKTFRQLLALNPKDKSTRQMLIDYFSSIGDKEALLKLGKPKN